MTWSGISVAERLQNIRQGAVTTDIRGIGYGISYIWVAIQAAYGIAVLACLDITIAQVRIRLNELMFREV